MTSAGYVIAGWVLTAVVLVGYWLWIRRRLRAAERTAVESERE
jgi:hypothetical protein